MNGGEEVIAADKHAGLVRRQRTDLGTHLVRPLAGHVHYRSQLTCRVKNLRGPGCAYFRRTASAVTHTCMVFTCPLLKSWPRHRPARLLLLSAGLPCSLLHRGHPLPFPFRQSRRERRSKHQLWYRPLLLLTRRQRSHRKPSSILAMAARKTPITETSPKATIQKAYFMRS